MIMMIKTKAIIELLGGPEEYIKATINELIEKMKKEDGVKIVSEAISDTKKTGKLWSIFVDLDLEINELSRLMDICFDYMPSSVEIFEPAKSELTAEYSTNLLNDLLARLHQYNMLVKNLHAENMLMKKKLNEQQTKD